MSWSHLHPVYTGAGNWQAVVHFLCSLKHACEREKKLSSFRITTTFAVWHVWLTWEGFRGGEPERRILLLGA